MTLMQVTLGAVTIILLLAWQNRREERKRTQQFATAFAGREPLTPEQFHERFFQGMSRDVTIGVLEILQEELAADVSCLRPEDDFTKNLAFVWDFDSMASVAVVVALEQRFAIAIGDADAERARTIADIVHLVARLLETRLQPPARH